MINIMRKLLLYIVFVSIGLLKLSAQELPQGICKFEKGELVFEIDLRWNEEQRSQLMEQYALDSSLVADLYNGKRTFETNGEKWVAVYLDRFHIRLQKPLQKSTSISFWDLLFGNDEKLDEGRPGYVNGPVYFGFNRFNWPSVNQLKDDKVKFVLPGYEGAKSVFLAGSFNNWLTYNIPLKKVGQNWEVVLELKPGKYYYKFIVDGLWIKDPSNLRGESDGVGSENSVLFVTNHLFKLQGYNDAQRVVVAGSFNGWNEFDAKMNKTPTGWELPAFVDYGKHAYKFKVDGQWILDPENENVEENEYGTGNSVLNIGDPAEFILKGYGNAENVFLAGSFNGWNGNDVRMEKTSDGWKAKYYIAPGNYEYKFIVDGNWIPDPNNPITHGTGQFVNSFYVYKPNHTFTLDAYPNAKNVFVTGSFNGWIHHGYKMQRKNGKWELDLFIPEGKVSYKFIVDGEWIIDPANPDYETNQYNTYNSVVWIE
jgi:hypothetical protein